MKRQRERALAQRRREKLARRLEAKRNQPSVERNTTDDIDPDIAEIIPGPQPPLAWQLEE